ncbi:unnamed protein product, partial [Rotaria sordida]
MKEIRPEPGSIYMLRLSIPEAFGIFESDEPEISSFASCASSSSTEGSAKSSASPTKPKKNNITNDHVSFHGHDPASTNTNATIVLPELTRNYVFKHLLSIYPNLPVFGRNSIKIKLICLSMYFIPKDKHYLILKPISISSGAKWPNPIPDFVESHELHYISQMIFELTTEERQSSTIINSQADKPTHEMKEIRPEPGSIYMLRLSIPEAFGIFESDEPEISSFASCASSSSTE